MPELPEVETVCRGLRKHLSARRIEHVEIHSADVIHQSALSPDMFAAQLVGQTIRDIERRGKYIIFVLDHGWLLCHLRMTGKLLVCDRGEKMDKHTHLVITLDNGKMLHYHDVRRFGGFAFYRENPLQQKPLVQLGPEPLSAAFDADGFFQSCRHRRRPIKAQLLDQSVVAGIGNIYADEILFRAGVRPRKSAARLSRKEAEAIVAATQIVLTEAIEAGGSTVRDYVNSEAQKGGYQLAHQVYGRAGEPCLRCGTVLKQVTVGGRSSVYCPHCQKS